MGNTNVGDFSQIFAFLRQRETAVNGPTPSHGGNTGSNPVGDANYFNGLYLTSFLLPKIFPKRCGWTALDGRII